MTDHEHDKTRMDKARVLGGRATSRNYAPRPRGPSLGQDLRVSSGPFNGHRKILTSQAFCYVHKASHTWVDCPANPEYIKPRDT